MEPVVLNHSYKKNVANIESIQIMRGIAAVLVVLLHISIKGDQYGNGALDGFSIGGAGVDLFFIISGYIMCISTAGKHFNFYKFILHRIQRIIPLYWFSTTVALGIYLFNPGMINTSGGETSILASYTLIPTGKRLLNSNGWTLSYEFFYYLIFGLFIGMGTDKAILLSSTILLSLVITGWCFNHDALLFYFSTHALYLEFVFGMLCYYFFNKKITRLAAYAVPICILGGCLLALELFFKLPVQDKGRSMFWGIPMLLFFIGLLSLEGFINRRTGVLKNLLLQIGNASYSLYLFHPFALSGTAMVLKRLNMASNPWLFTIILLISAVTLSYFIYLYIERPLTFFVKRTLVFRIY
jgi:exopolysaccharide production protein ExoZ